MAITYLSGNRIQGLSTDTAETLTYSTDFSSSTGWTTTGSAWSIGSGKLNFTTIPASDYAYVNIGSVSDSDWVLRYTQTYTTAGSTSLGILWAFLSDNTSGPQTNHKGIGWFHYDAENQGGLLTNLNTRPDQSPDGDYYRFNFSPSAVTRYIEIKRVGTSTLTINVYTSSDYSGNPEYTKTKSDVSSSITGLQYLKFMGYTTGAMVGSIDDVKFWNGVSSVNSKPTHVPANSRFEETDTQKIYYSDGSIAVSPDTLGSAADGTPNGPTQNAAGKVGSYSWSFDDVNDRVTLGSSLSQWNYMHTASNSWTINFWHKQSSTNENVIFSNNEDTNGFNLQKSGNLMNLQVWRNGGGLVYQDSTDNTFIPDSSNWYFYTITYDGTNMKWYRNADLKRTSPESGDFGTGNAQYSLKFGSRGNEGGYFIDGSFDELSFWNRALTSTEIGYLYNSGSGRTVPDAILAGVSNVGLKAYYNFEQTSGNLTNNAKSTAWSQVTVY